MVPKMENEHVHLRNSPDQNTDLAIKIPSLRSSKEVITTPLFCYSCNNDDLYLYINVTDQSN